MAHLLPFWLRGYSRGALSGDAVAGVIVALMLIPQGMAYALVAGLPPVTGLYASLLPAFAYALLGSSMVQSVGPMAITSLMTGVALAGVAVPGSSQHLALAALLALLCGAVLLVCGVLKLGFLANFLSRPVMSGFTSGAAIVITLGQLNMLFGLQRGEPLSGVLAGHHWPAISIGLGSLLLLWLCRFGLARLLRALGAGQRVADIGGKLGPVLVLALATLVCAALPEVMASVPVTGSIPSGLPGLDLSGLAGTLSHIPQVGLPAILITFVIFLSSQSAALTLAQRRNERIDNNRELLGLGAANLAAAVTGSFPVTGSISRSAVNFTAGANTPLASLISATLLALLLVLPVEWLRPLTLLPLPALAATIIIAVVGMVELEMLRSAWRYDRHDAIALLATAGGVVVLGVERGVVLGALLSFMTLIVRTSRPHIAILGRLPGTAHFRNVGRYAVETLPHVVLIRVDAALTFCNTQVVRERVERELQDNPDIQHVVLVMSAVNGVDTSGLFLLLELCTQLNASGRTLNLCEVKGPVMDKLKRDARLMQKLEGRIFLSTQDAFVQLGES